MSIADVHFDPLTFEETVSWIVARARTARAGSLCTPNADYVIRARRDPAFARALDACDIRVPDGMAVIYAARIAGRPLRRTVTGRLLLPAVARVAAAEGWGIALFGAGPEVAERARRSLEGGLPGLGVTDAITPPTPFELGSAEDDEAVSRLRAGDPRVIFVALGAPKQELWIVRHRADFPNSVLVGVGAALDVVGGRVREAPRWMTSIGLEWAFRLAQEPRRLARRYLIDDPWIFWWAVRSRIAGVSR